MVAGHRAYGGPSVPAVWGPGRCEEAAGCEVQSRFAAADPQKTAAGLLWRCQILTREQEPRVNLQWHIGNSLYFRVFVFDPSDLAPHLVPRWRGTSAATGSVAVPWAPVLVIRSWLGGRLRLAFHPSAHPSGHRPTSSTIPYGPPPRPRPHAGAAAPADVRGRAIPAPPVAAWRLTARARTAPPPASLAEEFCAAVCPSLLLLLCSKNQRALHTAAAVP